MSVKEFCKSIKNIDKVIAMVMVAPFFESRCSSRRGPKSLSISVYQRLVPTSIVENRTHTLSVSPIILQGGGSKSPKFSLNFPPQSPVSRPHLIMEQHFGKSRACWKQYLKKVKLSSETISHEIDD